MGTEGEEIRPAGIPGPDSEIRGRPGRTSDPAGSGEGPPTSSRPWHTPGTSGSPPLPTHHPGLCPALRVSMCLHPSLLSLVKKLVTDVRPTVNQRGLI